MSAKAIGRGWNRGGSANHGSDDDPDDAPLPIDRGDLFEIGAFVAGRAAGPIAAAGPTTTVTFIPPAAFGAQGSVRTGIGPIATVGTIGNFTNQDVNGILCGTAWQVGTITYSFPTAGSNYGANYPDDKHAPDNGFQVFSTAQKDVARYALSLIAQYTKLTFTEITETDQTHATLRLAGSSAPGTSYAFNPADNSAGGDVFLGNVRNDPATKAGYAFDTILHEIGHAVGLKHGQDADATYGVLPDEHASTSWSIMDYRAYLGASAGAGFTNAEGSGNQTYMTGDISALQYLYGANFASNASDTLYSWDVLTGEQFVLGPVINLGQGASSTNTIYGAIWDGGGVDTYDLSNYSADLIINLNPGEWSRFGTTQLADLDGGNPGLHLAPGNIINANLYSNDLRSLIENAKGGSGNDLLIGNVKTNLLFGGAGNDNIFGGLGNADTAWFTGGANDYILSHITGDHYTIFGLDGSDELFGIERLRFGQAASVVIGTLLEDHAGNRFTSSGLAPNGSLDGKIDFSGDQDWFATTLTLGKTYWFGMEGDPTDAGTLLDPVLRLLAGGGATPTVVVASNDDSGIGNNAFLSYTATATGTYYLSAQTNPGALGSYRVSEVAADDYAGGPGTTRTLTNGSGVNANIGFAGDTDWFRAVLMAGTTYWIDVVGGAAVPGTLADPYLLLLGNDGANVLATNDDSGVGLDAFLSYTPTATGTYYLRAQANGTGTGFYRLNFAVADDYAASPATTGVIAAGNGINATIETSGDTDWFATMLTAGVTYWFEMEGGSTGAGSLADPYLQLRDTDGTHLTASSNDGGTGTNAFISYTPTSNGTYFLSAQGFGTATGTYRVSAAAADDFVGNSATTRTLSMSTSLTAAIGFDGDTDWFRATLTAGTTYWFSAEGASTGMGTLVDPYLQLLGNDGEPLLLSDDDSGAGFDAFLSFKPTTTGTYYVVARANGSGTGSYRLSAQVADSAAGNPTTPAMLTAGGSAYAAIDFAGDTDWRATTLLSMGTTYWFNMKGSGSGNGSLTDPFLRLLGADGVQVLATNNDSGVGTDAFLSYTPTFGGVYYIAAQANGQGTGSYLISEAIADDFTDNPGKAGSLATGTAVYGTIDTAGDSDWFRTIMTAGTTYWFTLDGAATAQGTLLDPLLRILGDDGATAIASNNDSGAGTNAFLSYTPTKTGNYFVSAQASGGGTGTYRIGRMVVDDFAANPATTGGLSSGASLDATIESVGDDDWFRVTLSMGTTYWFSAEGSPTGQGTLANPMLRLLGNDGTTVLASDNDNGVGANAFLAYTPTESGTYHLSGRASGGTTGTYRVSQVVADDVAGNPATALTLTTLGAANGAIGVAGDTDWFRTTLTVGTTYQFNLEGSNTAQGTLVDPFMRLFGADGVTELAADDNSGTGSNAFILYMPLSTGTYYISGEAFGTGTGTYRLSESTMRTAPSGPRMAFVGADAAPLSGAGGTDVSPTWLSTGSAAAIMPADLLPGGGDTTQSQDANDGGAWSAHPAAITAFGVSDGPMMPTTAPAILREWA
jgi:hypothetical protein